MTSCVYCVRPGDSCINQLLSINHETLSALDMRLEVCGIFLDISKAFGKVWHDGLIFKLRQSSICGEMINILEDLVSDRKQNVFLNGNCSSLIDTRAGVPHRSIIGPLLFLICINDLSSHILKVNANCLLMTHLSFLKLMKSILQQIILIMI